MINRSRNFLLIPVTIVFLLIAETIVLAAEQISIRELGTLGGAYGTAYAINDLGQVVGSSQTASGSTHAFLWQNGVIRDLGVLPGAHGSVARGINNSGQVVGVSYFPSDYQRAFIWENDVMRDLGTLGGYSSSATHINDDGEVFGWSSASGGGSLRPFMWKSGLMTEWGNLCQSYYCYVLPLGFNDLGNIVGNYSSDAANFSFVWRDNVLTDLGLLPESTWCDPHGINNRGQVVGQCIVSPYLSRAFIWENGIMSDMGSIGGNQEISANQSRANGINDAGQVVGYSYYSSGMYHGFLWENGIMSDLGSLSGGYSSEAFGINSKGQIVGSGYDRWMRERAVLWEINSLPIANAGPDQTVSAGAGCKANVTLNGTDSTDADGDSLTYSWTYPTGVASGATPIITLPLGVHTIALTVSDGKGGSSSDMVSVAVKDTTPPVITILSPETRIYPHSDTLVISFAAADDCSPLVGSPKAMLDGNIVESGQSIGLLSMTLGLHTLTVTISDAAGNSSNLSVDFRVVASVDSLIAAVNYFAQQGLITERSLWKSLIGKLNEAKNGLTRGNINAARNNLSDFMNQVSAQGGKHIALDVTALLITDAQFVLGTL